MKKLYLVASIVSALALSGCSTVTSDRADLTAAKQFAPSDADKLVDKSALVVIGTAKSWRQTDDTRIFGKDSCRTRCAGVETTFGVDCVIRGHYRKEELTLFHYMVAPEASQHCMFCPHLVVFKTPDRLPEVGGFQMRPVPQYLLFLKQDKHGRFVPVSDQTYPGDSVSEVWGMHFGSSMKAMEKDTQPKN